MAIQFPDTPNPGDVYSYNNLVFTFNGTSWVGVLDGVRGYTGSAGIGGGGAPGGADTQPQYNDNGALAGMFNASWDNATGTMFYASNTIVSSAPSISISQYWDDDGTSESFTAMNLSVLDSNSGASSKFINCYNDTIGDTVAAIFKDGSISTSYLRDNGSGQALQILTPGLSIGNANAAPNAIALGLSSIADATGSFAHSNGTVRGIEYAVGSSAVAQCGAGFQSHTNIIECSVGGKTMSEEETALLVTRPGFSTDAERVIPIDSATQFATITGHIVATNSDGSHQAAWRVDGFVSAATGNLTVANCIFTTITDTYISPPTVTMYATPGNAAVQGVYFTFAGGVEESSSLVGRLTLHEYYIAAS